MKNRPPNLYPKFKAAMALSGENLIDISTRLGVTKKSIIGAADGTVSSRRLRTYVLEYIDQWLTPEVVR